MSQLILDTPTHQIRIPDGATTEPQPVIDDGGGGGGGGLTRMAEEFTTSGTWTKPTGVNEVTFLMCGGGGGGGHQRNNLQAGAGGGAEIVYGTMPVADDITVTIGAGGTGRPGSVTGAGFDGTASKITDGVDLYCTAAFGSRAIAAGGGLGGGVSSSSLNGGFPISRYGGAEGGDSVATLVNLFNDLLGSTNGFAPAGGSSIGIGGDGGNGTAGGDGVRGGGGGGSVDGLSTPANDAGDGGSGYVILSWWQ